MYKNILLNTIKVVWLYLIKSKTNLIHFELKTFYDKNFKFSTKILYYNNQHICTSSIY